jgi:hypothetical protein
MQKDEIGHKLSRYFEAFESTCGQRLPIAIQAAAQEEIFTLSFDRIGLVDRACEFKRDIAHRVAISKYRLLLRALAHEAAGLYHQEPWSERELSILYRKRLWDWFISCPCWPR